MAMVLCRRPSRALTRGVGPGTQRIGKAQGREVQGGVMIHARTIQRMPLAATDRALPEASGSR
jgi:hypothetical protein